MEIWKKRYFSGHLYFFFIEYYEYCTEVAF